jgi:hypothetical protein
MGDAGEKESRKKRSPQVVEGTEGSLARRQAVQSAWGLRAANRRSALVAQAEAITHAGDGDDVARARGAALDLAAEVADVDAD